GYRGVGVQAGNLNPLAVARYAQTNGVNMYFQKLLDHRDDFALNNYLCAGNPPILKVVGTPDHFILATGQAVVNGESTWNVNDPANPVVTLNQSPYNNSYNGMRLFSSAQTPLYVLVVLAHSPVELLMTD